MAEVMLSNDAGDEEKCTEIIRDLGILEYKDKHPMALSGGQKQRVAIAAAIRKYNNDFYLQCVKADS